MTFFDKKSEVISVELTSYGKYLLSKGKFRPVYYEFLDNDILYDSSYAAINNETRNTISERIKNETPRIKPQYVFTGVETKLKQLLKTKSQLEKQRKTAVKAEEIIENIQTYEKLYINSTPLGNSQLNDKYPALNFYAYNTEITSSKLYKQNNSHIINIPEIILKDTIYSSSVLFADTFDLARIENIEDNQPSVNNELTPLQNVSNTSNPIKIFSDNSYLQIEDKSIFLQFFEENTNLSSDNFEIEIFLCETGSNGQEIIKQLYFDTSQTNIVDDQTKVEYYFEMNSDNNISEEDKKRFKFKKQATVFRTQSTIK